MLLLVGFVVRIKFKGYKSKMWNISFILFPIYIWGYKRLGLKTKLRALIKDTCTVYIVVSLLFNTVYISAYYIIVQLGVVFRL